jgi:hypothetical protein
MTREDPDAAAIVAKAMIDDGVDLKLGVVFDSVSEVGLSVSVALH